MSRFSVAPGNRCAIVDLGDQCVDIPITITDGLPHAKIPTKIYKLLRKRGLSNGEIADLLAMCEHCTPHYEVALALEDGTWHVIDGFYADNDADANQYAEEHFPGEEWYVLRDNCNINGGKY